MYTILSFKEGLVLGIHMSLSIKRYDITYVSDVLIILIETFGATDQILCTSITTFQNLLTTSSACSSLHQNLCFYKIKHLMFS